MKKKILIINRWDDEFSDYRKHLPEDQYDIYMLILIGNEKSIEINMPTDFRLATDLRFDTCKDLIEDLLIKNTITKYEFIFAELIAFSEYDLIVAAQLRDYYNIPGDNLEQVLLWRDKNLMKEQLSKFGIRVPKWKVPNDLNDVLSFFKTCKSGIVLKPMRQAASVGVYICFTESEVINIYPKIEVQLFEYEVEEYISAPIGHVDGYIQEGEVKFAKVSKYIGTCLSFQEGNSLASYTLEDNKEANKIIAFARSCLKHLKAKNNIFHLELFFADEPIFLEVGMRIGGGEIPWVMRDVFKVNLFDIWMQIILKKENIVSEFDSQNAVAGFLMIPLPKDKKLLEVQFNGDGIQEIYSSKIMSTDNIHCYSGENEKMLASFRYKSNNLESLIAAIQKTSENFRPIYAMNESIYEKTSPYINS
ncbi:ATP-grasp domain-containing protein [Fluviispira vulneris]|uniref:ATP-grasp domain-containing protein n=1 Tax=Fluviispira vulneris TaxID=2763012 RepID=UPI001648CCA2|nr:ATP-grasp domain-containing protein [Fluviispira vulneris]